MNKKNCSGYDESTNAKVPSGIKKKRNFEEEEHAAFASKKPRRKRKLAKLSKDKGQKTMVSSSKCPDADVKRKQVRENLVEALSKVYGENNDETMKEQLRAFESVLFEALGPITGPNKPKYISILFCVNYSENPDFRRKILLGEVKPERILTMTDEEMGSHKFQEKIRRIRERFAG
ncbi:transcription factor [Citrus sinensis]|nr:transcription factor [Citrus sinensis]